ncbi:glutamate-rich protein GrpB [Bacillus sp. JCM 19046]|nr:glutamate-rich protein GrpB [Bacillus sp. JCM 19045]GAF18318.1 glutamate-rich protein GrpB [Bacillus sp. JCM 19046]
MTHHLYVCKKDSPALAEHLAFRNYLRKHPEEVRTYEQIKRELAQTANSREEYTEGKTEFVQRILRKAGHSS